MNRLSQDTAFRRLPDGSIFQVKYIAGGCVRLCERYKKLSSDRIYSVGDGRYWHPDEVTFTASSFVCAERGDT